MSRGQATWRLHLPHLLNKIAPTELASQPITTAFRGEDNGLFMGVDSKGASSGLWKSMDNGAPSVAVLTTTVQS